jgi:hypothetical protein
LNCRVCAGGGGDGAGTDSGGGVTEACSPLLLFSTFAVLFASISLYAGLFLHAADIQIAAVINNAMTLSSLFIIPLRYLLVSQRGNAR